MMGRSELLLLVGGFAALCSSKNTDDGRKLSNHEHGRLLNATIMEPPPDMEAMQEGKGGDQLNDGVVVGIVFAIVAVFVIAELIAAKTAKKWNLPFSGGTAGFWGGMPD